MIHFNWKLIRTYTVSILIPVALGAAVGLFISGSMDYETLNKPPLAPPAWLFPIVWTLLYVLMGVSYGMLAVKEETDSSVNAVYFGQLAVNLLWPVFLFVLKWRLFAFFWIIALAVLVILMAVRFYRRSQAAGLLQVPYVVWTLFASYLNLMAVLLNR